MAGMYIYSVMPSGVRGDGLEEEDLHSGAYHALEIDEHESIPDKIKIIVRQNDKAKNGGLHQELDEGTYWADLPFAERQAFYRRDISSETKREFGNVWRSFKNDPLQPVRDYFHNYVIVGIGLFLEGYVVFSISNNTSLFTHTYYDCWKTFTSCNKTWTQATTYLQLVGILIGQLGFGFMGDWIGRRYAMLIDMGVILLGVIMLTVSNGTTIQGWLVMYAIAQLTFGIGIGGEYPQTSTRATEESEEGRKAGQWHRGRKVMLSYTMQGWGQFINLGTLILLLLIFNSTGNPPRKTKQNPHQVYSAAAMGATWRTSFGLLIPLVLYVIYYRIYVLKELQALGNAKTRLGVKGYDWRSFSLLLTHYWHRLVGTGGCWFFNDWYFYGNGSFRSVFVSVLVGSQAGILTNWLWSFLNAGIQLWGYYFAALVVDFKPIGRKRLTTTSFFIVAAIFLCVAASYSHISQRSHIHWFQAMYLLSSFFALAGSHTTSFLMAAECYPTSVRSTAHGISAAAGKVGSIGSVVWLNYASTNGKFWIVWPGAFLGGICCWLFIPELTGLDLAEADRRWQYIRVGRAHDYHGVAVHPRHLSNWEKWVCGYHKQYNPALDREQRQIARKNGWSDAEAVLHLGEGI